MYGFRSVANPSSQYLSAEELNLFLAMMKKILKTDVAGAPGTGSIALYAQKRGEEAECVFILNLEEGEKMVLCSDGETTPSAYLADGAVKDLLNWPECTLYGCYPEPLQFGQLEPGVYYGKDDSFALVLNTTLGRFVMSSYVGFAVNTLKEFKDMNGAILIAMAGILRRLRTDDVVLRYSIESLLQEYADYGISTEFFSMVKRMFCRKMGHVSEVDTWEKWRLKEMEQGRGKLYFK